GEREIRFFPGGVRLTLYGDPVERGWRKGALVAGLGRGRKTVIGGGMKDLRKMAEGVLVEITPARGFFFPWGGEGPVSFREKMVQKVRTRLKEEKFPEDVAWFLGCLLTGRRAGGADVSKVLRETGLSHLLAVSGLHVGVAAAVTGSIVRLLLVLLSRATGRYFFAVPISCACGLISAFFLVFIHSFPPSAVRALTGFAFASAFSFNRCRVRDVVVDGLVFAFFCLLISHPEALFSPSFILSFSVTGGILLHLHSFGRKGRWNLSGTVGIPVAAYLFSLPLVSFLFRSVSPLSFIFNLIFVPLMLPLLSLSLVWEVFFFLGLDLPLLGLVSPLLNGLLMVLMRISEIPGIFVKVTEPPRPVWIVLYSSSLVLIYLSVLSWGLREGGKTRL
ncbi:MAG: ComEC/Rec2 family competence protein, partial [Deltaproteobacteria bacterium]